MFPSSQNQNISPSTTSNQGSGIPSFLASQGMDESQDSNYQNESSETSPTTMLQDFSVIKSAMAQFAEKYPEISQYAQESLKLLIRGIVQSAQSAQQSQQGSGNQEGNEILG